MNSRDAACSFFAALTSDEIDRCAVARIAEACASRNESRLRTASADLVLLARSLPFVESSYRFESNPMACILAYVGQHFRLLPVDRASASVLFVDDVETLDRCENRVPWRAMPVRAYEKKRMLNRLLLGYSVITSALMETCKSGRPEGEGDALSARCISILLSTVMRDVHEGPFVRYFATASLHKRSDFEPIKLCHGRAHRKRGTVVLVYDPDASSDLLCDTYRFLRAKGELFCKFVESMETRARRCSCASSSKEEETARPVKRPSVDHLRRRKR
ncbi:hypothetical protein CYMTET_37063 [Cymbomonas tetramitiformis]|uniref:Uncharacterized protein n=1 Tax=Cymbomonas tetramitiformis TaxID=36881 RepID=A0AAE0CG37_9CHLO|nr:hypothetical protein CYMTET_37063 [Cymbomonas tetramitiformis]